MTRLQALLAAVAIWALIYLPGLGSTEIKGEEGRRILPAVTMIETGDWIVPHIAGEAYLRKPPLVNWLIALSFKATGLRNEWAARLPSVLAILALALTTIGAASAWIGVETAFVAAVVMMTNIGLVEKGRLAEIEAIYTSLSGMACVCWVSWWARDRSPWLVWTVPFLFLGLAALAKGPLHLLFFYAIVIGILCCQRKMRALVCWPHLAGLFAMCAIFAAWAVPYFRATAELNAVGVWKDQMSERVGGGGFDAASYFLNLPRALGNFLPWLVFVPLWWKRDSAADADAQLFRGMRNATVLCFGVLMLIPGVLPRYTLPLFAPAGLLMAIALSAASPRLTSGWQKIVGWGSTSRLSPAVLALRTALLMGVLMVLFAILFVPRMNRKTRAFASKIEEVRPNGQELVVLDAGFQPALFYLRAPLRYVKFDGDLQSDVPCALIRADKLEKLRKRWRDINTLVQVSDRTGRNYLVVSLANRQE